MFGGRCQGLCPMCGAPLGWTIAATAIPRKRNTTCRPSRSRSSPVSPQHRRSRRSSSVSQRRWSRSRASACRKWTWCVLEEVARGRWGVGGELLITDDIEALGRADTHGLSPPGPSSRGRTHMSDMRPIPNDPGRSKWPNRKPLMAAAAGVLAALAVTAIGCGGSAGNSSSTSAGSASPSATAHATARGDGDNDSGHGASNSPAAASQARAFTWLRPSPPPRAYPHPARISP